MFQHRQTPVHMSASKGNRTMTVTAMLRRYAGFHELSKGLGTFHY